VLFLEYDIFWSWATIALSTLVAVGYCVIAFNWYFQAKFHRTAEAQAALRQLRWICICCGLCGTLLYWSELPWSFWIVYDLALVLVAGRTWTFLLHMRGLSLLGERLAQVDELERSARKYQQIAELLPHMVWTATAEGRVDFSNQRWHEFAGDSRHWLDAVHPDERDFALEQWSRSIALRLPLNFEARLAGATCYRTFVIKATPILQGDAVKWLGACADIEDQRLLAAEKEQQARQKSFFLNALSHDLRAPLHNVMLNAHLLKMGARDESDTESVNMIMENAMAAGDLVTKLLDFARVGAKDDNFVETIDIAGIVQQVVRRFMPIAEQKHLYLRTAGQPIAMLRTDRHKVERVISNLVDNALKYTNCGGVMIEVLTSPTQTLLRISDTGIGIPEKNMPFLFDEFYQVNNHERDRSKGFGMGLAICRCLARHVNGDVRLASTSTEGSCFEITLQDVGADRRGRSISEDRDRTIARAAGLCSV
jgi:signal transduction histidine kinase